MVGEDKEDKEDRIMDGVDNKIMDGVDNRIMDGVKEVSKKNLIMITDGGIIIMVGEIQWAQDQITMDGVEVPIITDGEIKEDQITIMVGVIKVIQDQIALGDPAGDRK